MSKLKVKKPLWLNWEGKGYFGVPHQPIQAFPHQPLIDSTTAWVSAFQHARHGNFRYIKDVAKLIGHVDEEMLYYTCADLLGDAAPSSVLADLLAAIAGHQLDSELAYAWCRALAIRGRLGDISTLFNTYEAYINTVNDDNDIILIRIAQVIDEADFSKFGDMGNFASANEYRTQLLAHCQTLAERHGGKDVLLFRGQPTSVRRMARMFLEPPHRLGMSLPSWTRHRFEASTGIDCTTMFDRRGDFKPLAAAAIAEAFLDSPAAAQYVDGVRYFFGHPVP